MKYVTGSIKDFALTCSRGVTFFSVTTKTLDLPEQTTEWIYSTGYVIRRNEPNPNLTIVLYSRLTNRTASISTDIADSERKWSDWDLFVKNNDLQIIDSGRTCFPPADIGIQTVSVSFNKKFTKDVRVIVSFCDTLHVYDYCEYVSVQSQNLYGFVVQTKRLITTSNWYFNWIAIGR